MRITFLGTAAAEGIPALWCECPVCRKAKQLGGKELRRRCSYWIDSDTLVDFGPDAFWQSMEFGIDLLEIKRIVFTHPHCDHLSPAELLWRYSPGFSQVSRTLTVIGSRPIFCRIMEFMNDNGKIYRLEDLQIRAVEAEAGKPLTDDDLELLPLAATHAPGLEPLFYVINRGGRQVLIANDTGWPAEAVWEQLGTVKLDAAIIECTGGPGHPEIRNGHLGSNTSIRFREKLIELGCLNSDAPVIVNHFSHNCGANHADLEAVFAPHGIAVAYDGLTLEV